MGARGNQVAVKSHSYPITVHWTAERGEGTRSHRSYSRNHSVAGDGKPEIAASSDPAFRGDRSRYNPEELLVASISSCHMLWYLHLCSVNQIVVLEYKDAPVGVMAEHEDGSGEFVSVELRPVVRIAAGSDAARAQALHAEAHHLCFIARSVNFSVENKPEILTA